MLEIGLLNIIMENKMKAIENYLNIMHFCFYKAHYKSHLLAQKINPFNLIHQLPFQKRRYEKLGIDIYQEIDKAFEDKNLGLSTTVAGGMLWGVIAVFFFSLLLLFNVPISKPYIIACALLSGVVMYYFVFKKDKYLIYFDKYEKCSKSEKRKFGWLTFATLVAILLLFYIGLKIHF